MELAERIADLEAAVNQLLIQNALSHAREQTLRSAVFGTLSEMLLPEQHTLLMRNYLVVLEEETNSELEKLQGYSVVPGSMIQSAQFDFFERMQRIRAGLQ